MMGRFQEPTLAVTSFNQTTGYGIGLKLVSICYLYLNGNNGIEFSVRLRFLAAQKPQRLREEEHLQEELREPRSVLG